MRNLMNFFTVKDFAKKIKMHPASVRRLIQSGMIYATRIGKGPKARFRIAETEIERLYLKGVCEENKT
jgi:hypothetical protein